MTAIDLQLEKHYKAVGDRPLRKFEETVTSFDRDIFWYNRDKSERSSDITKTTYEDHRKVVETAINIMGMSTQHDIAVCILTHRFFANYRASIFGKEKNFTTDYTFLVKKIGALFNPATGVIKSSTIHAKLKDFKEPTVVQLNHLAGQVAEVKIKPKEGETLNELAQRLSQGAPASTTYVVAGLKIGA